MSDRLSIASLRARYLLTEINRRAKDNILPAMGKYGVVSAVSGSLVAVKSPGDTTEAGQLLARAAGPPIRVGDLVALVPMETDSPTPEFIAVKVGGTEPAHGNILDGDLNLYNGRDLRGYSDAGVSQAWSLDAGSGDFDTIGVRRANGVPFMGGAIQGGRIVYLTNLFPLGSLVGVTLTANRVYYVPVYVPEDFTLNGIVFEITTIVAGDVQGGLYACASNFLPGARLVVSTKSAQASTGVKTFTITSTAIDGGRWYFVGFCSTSAMSIKGSTTGANLPSPRGGSTSSSSVLMANEDLSAGWGSIPATAAAGSLSNTYLHIGLQAA